MTWLIMWHDTLYRRKRQTPTQTEYLTLQQSAFASPAYYEITEHDNQMNNADAEPYQPLDKTTLNMGYM